MFQNEGYHRDMPLNLFSMAQLLRFDFSNDFGKVKDLVFKMVLISIKIPSGSSLSECTMGTLNVPIHILLYVCQVW